MCHEIIPCRVGSSILTHEQSAVKSIFWGGRAKNQYHGVGCVMQCMYELEHTIRSPGLDTNRTHVLPTKMKYADCDLPDKAA